MFFLWCYVLCFFFFFQAEDGIRDLTVTGVQTCALPISPITIDVPYEASMVIGAMVDLVKEVDPMFFEKIGFSTFEREDLPERSEERRVGKECRSGWSPDHEKEKAARREGG